MALSKARLRTLRSLRLRKRRVKEGKFLVEGVRVVGEALSSASVEAIIFQEDPPESVRLLLRRAQGMGVDPLEVDGETLAAISTTPSPQGVVAVVRREAPRWEEWLSREKDLLFLDGIQDPGNMGTLIRAGCAFDLGGVLVGKGSVDPFHPKVIRAGAGAHFRVGISEPLEVEGCLQAARGAGFQVVVAEPHGGTSFEEAVYPARLVLVLGNEGNGASRAAVEMADLVVQIPLMGGTESINVAVASGILLYHISRRERGCSHM